MAKYRLISIDKFEITEATGNVEGALRRLGGADGVKKLAASMLEGSLNGER